MTEPEELAFLDATAQAHLVRQKEIKPLELVEAAVEQIELSSKEGRPSVLAVPFLRRGLFTTRDE